MNIPDWKFDENVMATITSASLGFVAASVKVLADGKVRSMGAAVGAIIGGGLFAACMSAMFIFAFHVDPKLVAFLAGPLGAAGDHVIVALSVYSENWKNNPKDAIDDIKDLMSFKRNGDKHE